MKLDDAQPTKCPTCGGGFPELQPWLDVLDAAELVLGLGFENMRPLTSAGPQLRALERLRLTIEHVRPTSSNAPPAEPHDALQLEQVAARFALHRKYLETIDRFVSALIEASGNLQNPAVMVEIDAIRQLRKELGLDR